MPAMTLSRCGECHRPRFSFCRAHGDWCMHCERTMDCPGCAGSLLKTLAWAAAMFVGLYVCAAGLLSF